MVLEMGQAGHFRCIPVQEGNPGFWAQVESALMASGASNARPILLSVTHLILGFMWIC